MVDLKNSSTCLHFVVSANDSALDDCLNQFQIGDDVVFMDAGVMHLFSEQVSSKAPNFYFSSEGLDARGLLRIGRDLALEILDDRASANLLRNHYHCLTWK
jgi:sulfur transfer complex TusBCD TusB component (DsrH family)